MKQFYEIIDKKPYETIDYIFIFCMHKQPDN